MHRQSSGGWPKLQSVPEGGPSMSGTGEGQRAMQARPSRPPLLPPSPRVQQHHDQLLQQQAFQLQLMQQQQQYQAQQQQHQLQLQQQELYQQQHRHQQLQLQQVITQQLQQHYASTSGAPHITDDDFELSPPELHQMPPAQQNFPGSTDSLSAALDNKLQFSQLDFVSQISSSQQSWPTQQTVQSQIR